MYVICMFLLAQMFSLISAIAAYSSAWKNPCLSHHNAYKTFCNPELSWSERVYDLVYHEIAAFSIEKQASIYRNLSGNKVKPIEVCRFDEESIDFITCLDLPAYNWWNEALHGVVCNQFTGSQCNGPYVYHTTMFPMPIGIASSFNKSLFYQIGEVIGNEGRAMFNLNQSGLTFWAPNINIYRDPRWGRGQETPGEDPYLTSSFAVNFVRGMQGYFDNTQYLKTSACCKHFADYSLEDSDNYTRYTFDANVTAYDQNDTYFIAFKYCIMESNVSSIMCSYNSVGGIPSCANKELLTTVLRDEFGFYGYIQADDEAIDFIQSGHHYTNTTAATINVAYDAGVDINCGDYTYKNLEPNILNQSINIVSIQRAMYNAFLVQFRLGMFDINSDINPNPYSQLNISDINSENNQRLAFDATRQSIVLLKNKNNYLPLKKTDDRNRISLIGPNAYDTLVMEGVDHPIPPFIYTVYDGLLHYNYNFNIEYEKGCDINSNDTSQFVDAITLIKRNDYHILVMGLDATQENEMTDRSDLLLPGVQNWLIENVTQYTNNIILIILSGGCVDISEWHNNDNISAIIWANYPGMYGGLGIANIIFGDYNPSAKLTQTWYYNNYTQQILMSNMNMISKNYSIGRGYRYFDGNVLYPFGYGLSYTNFTCSSLQIIKNTNISLNITNTGPVKGSAVILIYFIPKNDINLFGLNNEKKPIKRLIAFDRVNEMNVNENKHVNMEMYPEFVDSLEQKGRGEYISSGSCQYNDNNH